MKNLLLHPTPIGTVGIVENGRAITDILFEEQLPGHAVRHTTLLLERAAKQLDEYFAGKRTSFDLPLEPEGTPYRKKVWQVLTEIPYGQTMTYGEIARRTGNPQASRAVGGANHHNPIPIVIPCHRVIGAGGKLLCGGFALTIGEPDPASLGGKDPDACGADAPGSSGDERDRFHTRLLSAACKTGGNVIQWEAIEWEGWI